jgi:hypothetical protein
MQIGPEGDLRVAMRRHEGEESDNLLLLEEIVDLGKHAGHAAVRTAIAKATSLLVVASHLARIRILLIIRSHEFLVLRLGRHRAVRSTGDLPNSILYVVEAGNNAGKKILNLDKTSNDR